MRKAFQLFVTTVLSALLLSSCGNKNETSGEKKNDSKMESGNENKNSTPGIKDNDQKKKEESSTLTEEDKNKSNELGMTPGLPASFPADIPQPKNSKTLGSLNSSEGTIVTFESNDNVTDIVSFYKSEMSKNGYTLSEGEETIITDKGGLISWKKDKKEVGMMLGYDKDKSITSLVITYK